MQHAAEETLSSVKPCHTADEPAQALTRLGMVRMLPIADASSKAISTKELQHVQELLTAYEAADNNPAPTGSNASSSTGNTSSSSAQPAATAAAAAGASTAEAEGEAGASWAGEEYEPDNVRCMQRSYLKFMKRLARQPQQCARWVQDAALRQVVLELGDGNALLCLNCRGERLPVQHRWTVFGNRFDGRAPSALLKHGRLSVSSSEYAAWPHPSCWGHCHSAPHSMPLL